MAQVVRSLPAVTAAPADFLVPNAAEWVIQAISANYDGSGAGSAFLPAVDIIAPGGVLVARFADRNVSVSAGGSAEVTFGPFLRGTSGAGGGGGITSITSTDGSITVTNPAGPTTDLSVITSHTSYEVSSAAGVSIANGAAATLSWSHANGSALWDYTLATAPLTKVAGIYAINVTVFVSADFTAGGFADLSFAMGDGGVSNYVQYTIMDSRGRADGAGYGMTMVHYMSTSARWSMSVTNKDGAASRTFSANAYAVKIT